MKTRVVVLAVLAVALIALGYWGWNEAQKRERRAKYEAYLAEQARENAQKARVDQERREAETRQEEKRRALGNLKDYLEREESLLKKTAAESEVAAREILSDQKKLSDVLLELETENAKRSEHARTNGWKRYDKAERVMMILKNPVMNELALKYLGEDFSAMRAECSSQIKTVLSMQEDTSRRLAENRKKYAQAVEGIDDDVDKKTAEAQEKTLAANKDLEKRLSNLEARRCEKLLAIATLNKKLKSPAIQNEINALNAEVLTLNKEIDRVREVVAVSRANIAHLSATMAETGARRRGDTAVSTRQDEDNAVHADMAHERSVFNLAASYEGRSLDRIRSSMRSRTDILNVRIANAQGKLEYIHNVTANADMMNGGQLEGLRRKIAAKLEEKVLAVAQ